MTAEQVYDAIGHGMRLRVPHNYPAQPAALVPDPRYAEGTTPRTELSVPVVHEVLSSGLLFKLTEHQEHNRLGWRECGMDGDIADWYVFIQ